MVGGQRNGTEEKIMKVMHVAMAVLATGLLLAGSAFADTYVSGYTTSYGTYVAPHYRSDANGTKSDNWSTRGNVNPYTGKAGTKSAW